MKKGLIIGMLFGLFMSCTKDEERAVLKLPASITGYSASADNIVLSPDNDSTSVVTLSWNAPDYGFHAATTYTLLIDVPADTSGANAWGNAIKVLVPPNTTRKSWLGTDFNKLMNQLGLPFGAASSVVVLLKSDVNQSTGVSTSVPTLNSVLTLSVTPYKVVLIFPKLYIAGDFITPQWTQQDLPGYILASVRSDNLYEGYINFTAVDNSFKLCTLPSWNGINYGWGGTATTISGDGSAGNCYFNGPAYCKVNVDVTALTVSYTPTQWTIAGDFNGWDVAANPMTFDPATNLWTATGVSLTEGSGFKFVGDPGWATNFGVDDKGNLAYNGGNIIAAKTGTFTVTLDLSGGAGNYSYSVK
jgi:hypothetical protein